MIRFFIAHPTAANILMVLFLAVGIFSLPQIKRETLPEIETYQIDIFVPYPGATPENVEQKICLSLESALDGISFMEEKHCIARQNLGQMTVKMFEHGDFEQFTTDVKNAIDTIDDFPAQVEQWTIKERGRTQDVVSVALAAKGSSLSRVELKALAEQVKQQLLRHPEIPIVEINDFSKHQLRVTASQATLRQHGLSVQELGQRVKNQNIELPLGTLKTPYSDTQIRMMDERRDSESLQDLVVSYGSEGNDVTIADIGGVKDTFERDENRIFYNDQQAAILTVQKNSVDDSLRVLNATEEVIEQIRQRLPETVLLTLTSDNTSLVKDRISLLISNAWQGLLLVFGVMWLFFSFKYAFWVVMGLPVSFLASFFLMLHFGISINMLSMVALLLALGILMDDAIVIAESIGTKVEQGLPIKEAVLQGTLVVLPGVLSSFVTTLCIFVGLVFIEGNLGQILKVIPIVLISVITVSLIEAFLILPNHLSHALQSKSKDTRLAVKVGDIRARFEVKFRHWNDQILALNTKLIRYRYLVIGSVVACFLFSLSMLISGTLKFTAFPDIDGDVLQGRLLMPNGTPFQVTQQTMRKIEDALKRTNQRLSEDEDAELVKAVTITYGENPDYQDQGANLATISVDLLSAEQRNTTIQAFSDTWREELGVLPEVLTLSFKEPKLGPQGRAVDVRLKGDDITQLTHAAYELKNWLKRYEGVQNITDNLRSGKPEYTLTLKPGTLDLGINSATIANQLRPAFQGTKLLETHVGLEDYEVTVKLEDESLNEYSDFDNFPIIHPSSRVAIPLSALVNIEQTRGFAVINRVDNQTSVSVYADVDSEINTASAVVGDLKTRFLNDLQTRFPDVTYTIEGEVKNAGITQGSMRRAMLMGMIGIFLLLALQFHSYIEPLIVMVSIPLAMIGVIWGHFIMGINFSMPSLMGFISLAGIVVNDSILLVQFVKSRVKQGMSVHEAAAQASHDRFRAVVLTSITTIAGMTPLLFETSLQAQILIPLATSIVFGIMTSTCLVLLVLPCLYSILEDFGVARPHTSHKSVHA
ncbi:efflux RND transporter permease subunit [Pseudoalteromonas luteoviolacea]|uniref:efflux RND transporter permease subunit n=1 Tax=Pseudoalteromonas luteoviolacea TaxID=43657 RepID=UPI001B3677C4|nr:efflux RND transporter permease subunit [Pseudoalteromonas luteoviolacea]MBQ4810025.1 efflux RND transporter permease subunit [Pseudoalteromonas luteoviolacea]